MAPADFAQPAFQCAFLSNARACCEGAQAVPLPVLTGLGVSQKIGTLGGKIHHLLNKGFFAFNAID